MLTALAQTLTAFVLSVTGQWPLPPHPVVVHGFDPPPTVWGAGHRGVDLAGRTGQPVRTALAGTVTFAGQIAGRGVVVVGHGARRTTYEPVTATVLVGETVATGARIGTLQAFGSHCRPAVCLHWGLLEGDRYLDPLSLVGDGPAPVRLLPLSGPVPEWRPPSLAGAVQVPAAPVPFIRPAGGPAGRPGAADRY